MRLDVISRLLACLIGLSLLSACVEPVSQEGPDASRILAMGDSLLAWNASGRNSISHVVEKHLGEEVVDRSISGAHVIYNLPITGSMGMRISSQYVGGDWDWVILNGGGNDLWLGCGCGECERRMTRMIEPEGEKGEIPTLVNKLRSSGAKVVYVGYLRSPGRGSPIEHCRDDGDAFEARIAKMADQLDGVYFVSNKDLVPHGDLSYHSLDRIHPSVKGSAAIGARVAEVIRQQDD